MAPPPKKRPRHQIKKSQKGRKSQRNVPEYYDEKKTTVTYSITPTAKRGIEHLSKTLDLSMSEFIEQIGRGLIKTDQS